MRVLVVEVDDQSHGNLVVFHMVKETATTGAFQQRPAATVNHFTLLVLFGRDLPNLFEAYAIVLWCFTVIQVEFFYQLLAQMATAAFGKHCIFGV